MQRRQWRRLEAFLAAASLVALLAFPAAADEEENLNIQAMRVAGGGRVGPGEFPSTVALHVRGPSAGTPEGHMCGATVIAPRWVLTAAHCVTQDRGGRIVTALPASLVVVEGRDGATELRREAVQLLEIEHILVHPGYTMVTRSTTGDQIDLIAAPYDVALLRLQKPASHPAQTLAAEADRSSFEQPGRGANVVGFGQTIQGGPASPVLLRGSLPVVDIEKCRAPRRALRPDVDALIGPSQLCAGFRGGSVDSCRGDSGGPLFVRGDGGAVVQAGIVSLGPPCHGTVTGYGTYASVAAAACWIARQVPEASFTHGERAPLQADLAAVFPAGNQPRPPAPVSLLQSGPEPIDDVAGRLGSVPGIEPSRTAQLSIDIREGTRLPVGSLATFRVVSSVEGLLVVAARDPEGKWMQLFPNDRTAGFMPGQVPPVIHAGQTVLLPGPADGFRMRVQPPPGEGLLAAMVLPHSTRAERLVGSTLGLDPLPDPRGYFAALADLAQSARSMAPEVLPTNVALGTRRFTVVPAR